MRSEQKSCFSSSSEVFSWLDKFINLERGQKPKSFRIDRMQFLCKLAGHPEKCAPSIHVAGSKGKGSVTSMITSILTAAGFRAARYTSPHVTDIRERICLGSEYFTEDVYCAAGNELRELAEKKLPANGNPLFDETNEDGCEPTYFELLTLFFFLCARRGKCNAMAVETGMGGRLDSTNVLNPLASVITLIELEHTSYLGDTIEKIAEEKAGIIKQGKPLILAKQPEEALAVFQKTTHEKNSQLIYLPDAAEITNIKITPNGTDFSLQFKGQNMLVRKLDYEQQLPATCSLLTAHCSLPVPGRVYAHNAALAITAAKTAFPNITEDAICAGLADLRLPARFEKISDNPPFIIDGAHTPESLELCIETFTKLYGKNSVLIFGCAADKDALTMARIACPHFSKIIITSIGSFKANDPKKVYEAFAEYGKEKVILVEDINESLRILRASLTEGSTPPREVLCTGSFYLVSEIRKLAGLH